MIAEHDSLTPRDTAVRNQTRAMKLQPHPQAESPARDLSLEGLRGLCALGVFCAHVFLPAAVLDPHWVPSQRFWWFDMGIPAVLMFFVLSGYVIGLVTTQTADNGAIRSYLAHRFARLVPLNTIAVVVSCLLFAHVSLRILVGNLLFLENEAPYPGLGVFPLLLNNPTLWSLNYEVFYYLVFLAVWRWAPSVWFVALGLTLLVGGYALGLGVPAILGRYACGGFYWFAGLTIAWLTPPVPPDPDRKTNWPAAFLAAHAMWGASPLRISLYDWELYSWLWTTPISPHRLDFLFVAIWLLLAVTGRAPKLCRWLTWICLMGITTRLACEAIAQRWESTHTLFLIVTLGAWAMAFQKFSVKLLARLAPLGAISFGLYIIASPIQIGQRALWPEFSGSSLTYAVRFAGITVISFAAAWILERRLGPPLSSYLRVRLGKKKAI